MTELNLIQTQLVSKKSNYNDFSKFNYRSLEDIMANVKPLLQSYGCTIVFSDELVLIGDRYYIKATCTLKNSSGEQEQAVAYAREPETLKGMSEPQVTGTASSYARKYAVCSLLAIDDNKDVDSMDNRDTTPKTAYKQAHDYTSNATQTEPFEVMCETQTTPPDFATLNAPKIEELSQFGKRVRTDENKAELTKFMLYYRDKVLTKKLWDGKFNPEDLWQGWLARNAKRAS